MPAAKQLINTNVTRRFGDLSCVLERTQSSMPDDLLNTYRHIAHKAVQQVRSTLLVSSLIAL
jgi:hypothetical protein